MEIQTRVQQKKGAKEKAKAMATAILPNGPEATDQFPNSQPPNEAGPSGSSAGRTLRPRRHDAIVLVDIDSDESEYSNASDITSNGNNNNRARTNRKARMNNNNNTSGEYCLNPEDPANFLKLASALKLLLADALNDQDIDEGDRLIREYNTELITVSPSLYLAINP